MVRAVIKDIILLGQRSTIAGAQDIPAADDLLETLKFHSSGCVGMAANMIGVLKRIIAVNDDGEYLLMLNPELLSRSEPYEAEEGCLSLEGKRRAQRYGKIKLRWQNRELQTRVKVFTGFTAQIIQHELDHCDGIII